MSKIDAAKDPGITQREIDHMALSRKLAGECVVLLENDGALPLGGAGRIALYGNGARQTVRGGTGSGDVNTRSDVTAEQGLERAGFQIATKAWLDRQEAAYRQARKDHAEWISAYAREHDMTEFLVSFSHPFQVIAPVEILQTDRPEVPAAVYVIARSSGEGSDRFAKRGDYLLYDEEKAQLELLGRIYDQLIVVLNVGGVMDMSEIKAIPGVNAVLLMSQLGSTGGDVLADVLLGKVDPSGRLTDTWAKRYGDHPSSEGFSHNDGNVSDEYYTEGIYVGYRYFDTFGVEPVYPFGYGKSYTDFSVTPGAVRVDSGQVRLSVSVKNTGTVHPGKEVVQVYYSAPAGKLPKPYQELAAFAKTRLLAPGESETLEIAFPVRDMASYCEECAAWVLEAGEYVLRTGVSSRSTEIAAVLTLEQTVKTEILKNLFAGPDPVQEILSPAVHRPDVDAAVPRLAIDPGEIPAVQASYSGARRAYTASQDAVLTAADVKAGRCTVEELTVEEMANICVGTLRKGGSIVGNASCNVPGAAGDTSPILRESRGVKNMVLADGPAGLRLQPVFRTDKAGDLLPGDLSSPLPAGYTDEDADTYYQYCTAIPIGWALAQSWNMELLREIGSMVGREMEAFGVDLWLAPALNIHRDPLCGRNFEYYSEDPLISGKAAAAITQGIQAHPGKGTTIKHFAANNQEDNRYFTNSHISERAIREIYLKGFEIAVKESQPLSIMTSYNLLNGIHTANHFELLQSAARDEWGFRGFIMTDWFTSQRQPALTGTGGTVYPVSASTGCVHAGNDVQMPGCQENVDDRVLLTGE